MTRLKSSLCLAFALAYAPANAEPVQQVPPLDAVMRIEQGYWNSTRRENHLPEDSAFVSAKIIRCTNDPDRPSAYTELMTCSIKVSYRTAKGSIRHVSNSTNYGQSADGAWAPVITSNVVPLIGVSKP